MPVVCEEMKQVGIQDPEQQDGINLCLNCPYPNGCVLDNKKHPLKIRAELRKPEILEMCHRGLSTRDIATIMGISTRTVHRAIGGKCGI